jgi:RimJ/RimL family protein N-acetyltransferase
LDTPDLEDASRLYQEGAEWMTYTVPSIPQAVAVQALVAPDSVWYVLEAGGKVVGLGGYERVRWIDRVAEPFIVVDAAHRRNGMGEALGRKVVEMGLNTLNLRRISTVVLEDSPSKHILDKCGFKCEGRMVGMRMRGGQPKDGLAYALVKESK